jgi:hypothetical protein
LYIDTDPELSPKYATPESKVLAAGRDATVPFATI